MPRATCRCGQKLSIPVNGPERVVCPKCSARVRVRRASEKSGSGLEAGAGSGDGYLRFACKCGRRLKVREADVTGAEHAGKCPDCGRLIAIPPGSASGQSAVGKLKPYSSETPTEEMTPAERLALDRWADRHLIPQPPQVQATPEPRTHAKPPSRSRVRARSRPESPPAEGPYHDQDTISVVGPAPVPTPAPVPAAAPVAPASPSGSRVEAGLRVCPRCGRPLHLSAVACRECGAPVPKR